MQQKIIAYILPEASRNDDLVNLIKNNDHDCNFEKIKKSISNSEIKEKYKIVVNYLKMYKTTTNPKTYDYFITLTEKYEMYKETLELLLLTYDTGVKRNPTKIRGIFRICRKLHDYSKVEKLFKIDSRFIIESDFNIQYELVYYFEEKNDEDLLKSVLKQMHNSAESSLPIAKTLYNFQLKFNLFDESEILLEHINKLEKRNSNKQLDSKKSKKDREFSESRIQAQNETEIAVRDRMQELVSDQEHNRQMIAIRDLLKGFSHELGQPITNIRYAIQLYNKKVEKKIITADDTTELLAKILNQTERLGKLIKRFGPIVSSKSTKSNFKVLEVITQVFNNLSERIKDV